MIALVDCNNFYASCEKLFQPQLKGRPVVVLSNNDGCVIARSDEAKLLGIEMGAPVFLMEEMLEANNVAIFSSNYTLYGSLSDRVMRALGKFTPEIEIYSIDEAFLMLDNSDVDYFDFGIQIREYIRKNVGIPVSVGIAPSKTLAKMANRFAKKTKKGIGCHVVNTPESIDEILRATEVHEIWGIGKRYTALLLKNGLKTAYDVSKASENWILRELTVVGHRMWKELNGIPAFEMEYIIPNKKNICVSRSFGQLLSNQKDVGEALSNYVAIAARKLRSQRSCAKELAVFLQTNNFRSNDPQYFRSINMELPVATNNTTQLLKAAGNALSRIWRDGYKFKKVGVTLLDLKPDDQVQYSLFDNPHFEKDNRVMKTMDEINRIFGGKDVLKIASQGYGSKWKLRQLKLSPCYTTRISDILTIKI
ncbi:Y-family DNA polymerase [Chitinophaga pendula]|uniref:Y-family DNA polymerase n=1 Tax=Chitinophaga TaxID=79328 RepID=UPI000BAF546D|nr:MULTISPECIES: Y-family DNA polymerase [Chitinophaga]ASZ15082.1 SOS mutagenesis and repair protein UmuC [Chitinophaga sp. MD30]UCJ08670.1 Y-family DNA polymerase [Chitinophaga pendula]